MYGSLRNKNVLLTGASGGIGESLALELAQTGCNLFLTGRNEEKLKLLRAEILDSKEDIRVFSKSCDLEKEDD